jgi:DNA-binding IclR family transcriptional regulator
MKMQDNDPQISTTVLKAFEVIESLAAAPHPQSAQELSETTGIPRSTIYRLIRTLERSNYIDSLPDAKYRLSTKILKLGRSVLDQLEISSIAKPILRELREHTGEMSLLAIREDQSIFLIGKYETTHSVRMYTRMGTSGHLHSTALGKAILAFTKESEREKIITDLHMPALTENTITNAKDLRSHLREITRTGYAIEDKENQEDICSIAAPIFNHMDEVVASLGTSGPSYRLDANRLVQIAPMVMQAAEEVSLLLGSSRFSTG